MNHISPLVQAQLCEAILRLLEENDTSKDCLSNFSHCVFLLDLYNQEIPAALLNELHAIIDDYVEIGDEGHITFCSPQFSDEEQVELVERLLSIYIDVKGGNLIF